MLKLYFLDVDKLLNEEISEYYMKQVSSFRLNKINSFKNQKDKILSLGASILLDKALNEFGLSEKDMEYQINENGKPFFKSLPKINFSISHSGSYSILAISDKEVGVDIEEIKDRDITLADHFYHKDEKEYLTKNNNLKSFLTIWTLKESYIKMLGKGLSKSLKSFSIIPVTPIKVIEDGLELLYKFKTIDIDEKYICSLCYLDKEEIEIENITSK